VVHLDDDNGAAPPSRIDAMSQDRRNDLNRALRFMLAKSRCHGHTLQYFLGAEPSPLMPAPALEEEVPSGDLIVNPSFRYEASGETPLEIRDRVRFTDSLLRGFPLAWIEDWGTGIWVPLWARDEWVAVLESLRPGEPAPSTLTRGEIQTLASANVLVSAGAERTRRATWDAICLDAAARFRTQSYAIVRQLIHPVLRGELQQYYRALVADARRSQDEDQRAQRYRLHSEPAAMFLQPQLATLVSRIAGEPVKPSYVYFTSYPAGSALPPHIDREQCEFSISLLVDYIPTPIGASGWPLFLEHPNFPDGVVAADLAIGDAVVYRGRQLRHYRDRLSDGHQSSSVFLHYVREDFVGDIV
jgi:hypothetical protein